MSPQDGRKRRLRKGGTQDWETQDSPSSEKVKPRASVGAKGTQVEHGCPLVVRVWKCKVHPEEAGRVAFQS